MHTLWGCCCSDELHMIYQCPVQPLRQQYAALFVIDTTNEVFLCTTGSYAGFQLCWVV